MPFKRSFTDGTVAGTDVVTGHDDPEWRHDYTYYGNGCENKWDDHAPLNNQSEVSCSSRLTETADEETQKIGTYYNFSVLLAGKFLTVARVGIIMMGLNPGNICQQYITQLIQFQKDIIHFLILAQVHAGGMEH